MLRKDKPPDLPPVSEEELLKLLQTLDQKPYPYSNIPKTTQIIGYLLLREARRLRASTDTLLWVTILLFLATLTLLWNSILLVGRGH